MVSPSACSRRRDSRQPGCMKLRTIEILGFRSFRLETVIEIGDGITSVVGPNGYGKSNVVEAIRWAMGSQSPRDLRGKAMEDVIFAGSEKQAPVDFAEVSLIFDNTEPPPDMLLEWRELPDIKVTRRLLPKRGLRAKRRLGGANAGLLWAELLLRTSNTDAPACPACSGRMRIISTIGEGGGDRANP